MAQASFRIEQLKRENYETWAMMVQAVMMKSGTWGHVTGQAVKPTLKKDDAASVAAVEAWEKRESDAWSDLIMAIGPAELPVVQGIRSAKGVWDRLKSEFDSESTVKKAVLLRRVTATRLTEGDDVRKYVAEFMDAIKKLKAMNIVVPPEMSTILMLLSLPPSFDNFRCICEFTNDIPTPETLKVKILEECDVRESRKKEGESAEAMLAYKSRRPFKSGRDEGKRENKDDEGSEKKRFKCFKCHKPGHNAKNCPRRGVNNNNNNNKSQQSETTAKVTDEGTIDAYVAIDVLDDAVMDVLDDACAVSDALDDAALGAQHESCSGRWCLDSGCTSHMCNSERCFVEKPMTITGRKLCLANEATAGVRAKGTVGIVVTNGHSDRSVQLHDTLLVPDLRTNLLSVARIVDHGNTVTFTEEEAVVRDKWSGKVKLQAKRSGNLYFAEEVMTQSCMAGAASTMASLEIWHRRFGHLNVNDFLEATRKGVVAGVHFEGRELGPCDTCLRGKMTVLPFPKKSSRCTDVLEIVHSDVWGPMKAESLGRARYFVTFVDDCSRWCEIVFLRNKSDVFQAFKNYKVKAELQTGKKLKCLMSDNGREYCNNGFDEYLKANGIVRRLTVSHTPQQNGVAERKNRTLADMARCLMLQSGLNVGFWAEAIATANYIRNRCPTSSLEGRTPFEVWKNEVPNLSHLRIFGATAYVLNKDPGKGKLEARSRRGTMVGYSEEAKGYRVWLPECHKVVVARDVQFVEDEIIGDSSEKKDQGGHTRGEDTDDPFVVLGGMSLEETAAEETSGEMEGQDAPLQRSVAARGDIGEQRPIFPGQRTPRRPEVEVLVRAPGRPTLVRSGSRGRPRKVFKTRSVSEIGPMDREDLSEEEQVEDVFSGPQRDIFYDAEEAGFVDFVSIAEISTKDAMNGKESAEWLKAITEEIRGLIKNDTWKLVDRPRGRSVVSCKIVLRNKLKPDGTLDRRKARVVARGFTQRPGIDFIDTFAPVARLDSVRLLMALAVQRGLVVYQLDIVAAYLNGVLNEEIYMEQPDYFQEALETLVQADEESHEIRAKALGMLKELERGNQVCLLQKALYGLRQAGRQWHEKLDQVLIGLGLKAASNDTCFYYAVNENEFTVVVVYVDDILYTSNDPRRLRSIVEGLSKEFEVKDLGQAHYCLGIEIEQKDGRVKLSQASYCRDLLKKFGMDESKPVGTPADPKAALPPGVRREKNMQKELPYRQLIGSLMYLAVATRPDLAFTVNRLAQYNDSYQQVHWAAAKRVLRYLKGTLECSLVYEKTTGKISGFSDADYANDIADRKSYTGYVFTMSGAAISWRSQKQRSVVLSSTEAEYVALSEAAKEAMYWRNLTEELGLNDLQDITIGVDNQGAKFLAENAVYHTRTKHISTRFHFVRQLVIDKQIKLEYVPTSRMPADILTKPLPGPAHHQGMAHLGLQVC